MGSDQSKCYEEYDNIRQTKRKRIELIVNVWIIGFVLRLPKTVLRCCPTRLYIDGRQLNDGIRPLSQYKWNRDKTNEYYGVNGIRGENINFYHQPKAESRTR